MSEELPNEMWALVLRKVHNVRDFARLQRLCKTFQTLVINNCWTNVKSIALRIQPDEEEQDEDEEERVQVEIETKLPGQYLHLPMSQAALLLEKLVHKATKITEISIDFHQMDAERHDQVLHHFFHALTAQIKVNKFHMSHLKSENHLTTAVPALARFLGANTQSLTDLSLFRCFGPNSGQAVPEDLMQAFQACQSLEKAKLVSCAPLVGSVLEGQTQLLYLALCVDSPNDSAVAVLESGARLLEFYCYIGTMEAYLEEVHQRHRSLDHPLQSVKELELDCTPSSVPWALFPNLELMNFWDIVSLERAGEMAKSFLAHWSPAGVKKVFECRLEGMWRLSKEDLCKTAAVVQAASGCRAIVSAEPIADRTIFFQKGLVTFKILLPGVLVRFNP